jgi:hypothetical protein
MKAYKLVRKLKSGEISPLFINKKSRLPLNKWISAEEHPTKGFAVRKGWHCTLKPKAPHLQVGGIGVGKNRVWAEVEVENYKMYKRPKSQGGIWLLAQKIKFTKIYDN